MDISMTHLANQLGISKQSLNSKLAAKDIGIGFLQDISMAVNRNIYELMGKVKTDESNTQLNTQPNTQLQKIGYPLVSVEAVAGFGNADFAISEEDVLGHYLIPDLVDVSFMLRVRGSSMVPKYNAGDIVACRIIKSRGFIQWNKIYVIATKEQGILVKRLHQSEKEGYYLAVSDNPHYKPFDIPFDEISGIALVLGAVTLEA